MTVGFTKYQVQNMDPNVVSNIAAGWDKLGTALEQKFDSYVSLVKNTASGGYWEGKAAEAAQNRAGDDRKVAVKLVDELQGAAKTARGVATDIGTARTNVLNKVVAISAQQFTVWDNWSVTDTSGIQDTGQRAALARQYAGELTTLVNALVTADSNGAKTINGLAANLIAKFTNPASLSGQQGTSDGQALQSGKIPPDVLQRLKEAGSLTPEQLKALQSGEPVDIPASQMEYINALMRSLDGKSPEDIEKLLNSLPTDARTGMANTFQIASNGRVTASVEGNVDVPTSGGFNLLPQKMRDSLTRKDLVQYGSTMAGTQSTGFPILFNTVNVNGVGTNQAIARIAGMGDANMRAGSSLDGKVMDVAGQYLDAQVRAETGPKDTTMFSIDGHGADPKKEQITEPMFHAVADDKFAVAAAVTDPHTGQRLVGDVFQHEWPDNGKTVSELFHTTADDAVAKPGDPVDTKNAQLHGQIAEATADYMADHKKDLLRVPGYQDKMSAGQLNPDLMRNLADDLAPYYSTFAGAETIPGVHHFEQKSQLANMYAVLASDPEAGVKAASYTYAQENALAAQYGSGNGVSTYGQLAGQMHSALVDGTLDAKTTMGQNDVYNAQWQYAVNSANFDTAKSVATTAFDAAGMKPAKWAVDIIAPQAKLALMGIVDQQAVTNPQNGVPYQHATNEVDSSVTMQNVLNGLESKDPAVVNDPALASLRETEPDGDVRLVVQGLTEQELLKDRLKAAYGIDLEQWTNEYDVGARAGVIQSKSGR